MKTKLISSIILALFIGVNIFAQSTYQIFPTEGFKVKCQCKLYVNKTFMQLAKQQGTKDIIAAYICAENEDSPDYGVIYNINIYDESKSYMNIPTTKYVLFEKKYLEQYAISLANAGISHNYTTYQGVSAIEYTFDQMGLPTKAIMFLKNKKSYLVQVATRNNVTSKYYALKTSFEVL